MSGQDELSGRSVGEFVLRERIGEGGFGAVYRCEQPLLGRQAVVKVLHSKLRASEVMIQRFLREARLASRLDHPYAAHVYAFGVEKDDGLLWIAMEMVDGTTLDRWLRDRGPLPVADLVPFFERIAEVVQTAHDRGIVHRDLKPSNVMVIERAGRLLPKLLDLGIAKLQIEDAPPVERPRSRRVSSSDVGHADTLGAKPVQSEIATLTASHEPERDVPLDVGLTDAGAAMGSPPYMAPEQWSHEPVGSKADLYALGVLAFEALSGRRPFIAATLAGFADQHTNAPVPALGPGFAPALDRFFEQALAKRPEDRPANALALAAALRLASGLGDVAIELPKLDRDLHDAWIANAPQPLAETVAALEGARNLHQGRDAARAVLRGLVRYLLVLALAARVHVRDDHADPELDALLRALRRRDLDEDERVRLLRRLVRPFSSRRAAHPVPELVDFLAPRDDDDDALDAILELEATSDPRGVADDLVHAQLVRFIAELGRVLRAAAFVHDYPLVVMRGGPERWMGLRRARRPLAIVRDGVLVDDQPALLERSGKIALLLWPLVQPLVPAPGAETELFVFDGRGRSGARLVAAPTGFERHDAAVWDWFGEHVLSSEQGDVETVAEAATPYLGLATFATTDATRFVGRERETDGFLNRLRGSAFQVVVGASGAGKSSFINAGVVPALPSGWRVITMRPGVSPLATLAAKLQAAKISSSDLRSLLEASPAAAASLIANAAGDGAIVFVIDQLEELVTLCLDETERLRFASVLAELTASSDGPIRVICTVRDDFLMRVESLPPLRRRLSAAVFLLGNPSREDLVRTIVEPARQVGYELSDAELADEMAASVEGSPGALALLSFTASRLWELRDRRFRQLTRKAYDAMGGVGGALGHHAEETLAALGADEQRLVREAFRRLVTADGTRAQLSLAELEQVLASDRASSVIDKLIVARLLVTTDAEDGSRVEVAHEALLAAWPRAQQWIREDADTVRMRDQLRSAARQWDDRGRSRGLLWRGDVLTELQLWRRRDSQGLTVLETAFADASVADAARGRRRLKITLASIFAILAVAVVILLYLRAAADRERTTAQRARDDTEKLRRVAQEKYVTELVEQSRAALLGGESLRASQGLLLAHDEGVRGRDIDAMLARAVTPLRALQRSYDLGRSVRVAELSPDGKYLLAVRDGDPRVALIDLATGTERNLDSGDLEVFDAEFGPGSDRVATAGRRPRVWSTADARPTELRHGGEPIEKMAFSSDGTVVVASSSSQIYAWNAATGELQWSTAVPFVQTLAVGTDVIVGDRLGTIRRLRLSSGQLVYKRAGHKSPISRIAISADGTRFGTASFDHTARVWDLATGNELATLHHLDAVAVIAFGSNGLVLTAGADRVTRVWRSSGEQVATLGAHRSKVTSAAFDRTAQRIVSAGADGTICVFLATGTRLDCFEGHRGQVIDVGFSPDGRTIASGSLDGTLRTWQADLQAFERSLSHGARVGSLQFSPNGRHLATSDGAGVLQIWSADGTKLHWSKQAHARGIEALAFAPDSTQLMTTSSDGTATSWDVQSGRAVREVATREGYFPDVRILRDEVALARSDGALELRSRERPDDVFSVKLHDKKTSRLVVSSDQSKIVTASDDGTAVIYDRASRKILRRLTGHAAQISGVAISPDGQRVATSSFDCTVRLWGLDGTDHVLVSSGGFVASPRFSRDGTLLLTAHEDGIVRVWSTATGKETAALRGHEGVVWSIAVDPHSDFIASSAANGTAILWDLARIGSVFPLTAHTDIVHHIEFAPDGKRLVTGSWDGTVKIWAIRDGGLGDLDIARRFHNPR